MEKEIKVLISACLLGDNVKYSGGNNLTPELVTLLEKYNVKIVKFVLNALQVYLFQEYHLKLEKIKFLVKMIGI